MRQAPARRAFRWLLLPALVLLAAALLMGAPAQPALAHASSFPDVNTGLPAHDAIEFMTGAGVISGYKDGTFQPGKTLTRGQATKVLVLWQDVDLVKPASASFPDLDDVYRSYVETASAKGWISGFPDGFFRPYSTLNRQQMAIIMVRAMGWEPDAEKLSSSRVAEILGQFSDQAKIAAVARPYVALAVSKGLFGGYDGRFAPTDGITRAQFSLVVMRAELALRAVIQQVRSAADHPDKTRVVVDLSRAPGKVTASVAARGILNVDYTGGAVSGVFSQAVVSSPELSAVTATQVAYDPRTVRISFDLSRYQRFQVMTLAPSEGKGYRIVVDVYRRTDGPDGDGPPLICLDPGHGGSATGCIGVSGTPEKTINLAIATFLAEDLRQAGLNVLMTRTTDVDVGLQERADIANAAKASLFVSVHNNAISNPETNGTETFYEGTDAAYDPQSRLLAEAIQRKLLAALGSTDRRAKTWYGNTLTVLGESDMTGALTEVGFMTNAAEEAKLLTPAYQQKAAQAIADGILEYLKWSTAVSSSE